MAARKKITPAVHAAGQKLRKGSSVAGLAENERAQIRELKAENIQLRKENVKLRQALKSRS